MNLSTDPATAKKRLDDFTAAAEGNAFFLRAQLEVAPTTGMPHYQMCLKTTTPYRLSRLIKSTPGVSWATGQVERPEAMLRYCEKVDTRAGPEVLPELPRTLSWGMREGSQGKRTDIDKIYQWLQDQVAAGVERNEILTECARHFPADFIRMHQGIGVYLSRVLQGYKHDLSTITPWPHQKQLLNFADTKPDGRSVHILLDEGGGSGKSMLLKQMLLKFGDGAVFLNGEMRDMCWMLTQHDVPKVVIMDFARSTPDAAWAPCMNLLEQVTNGIIMSGKYVPQTKYFKPPHVFVCCNRLPAGFDKMLSADRPVIWRLRAPKRNSLGDIVKQYPLVATRGMDGVVYPFHEFTVVAETLKPAVPASPLRAGGGAVAPPPAPKKARAGASPPRGGAGASPPRGASAAAAPPPTYTVISFDSGAFPPCDCSDASVCDACMKEF